MKSALLEASVLRKTAGKDSEAPVDVQKDKGGCVFRYKGKKSEFPEGMPDDMDLSSILIDKDSGIAYTDENGEDGDYKCYVIAYSKIYDDLYYMKWEQIERETVKWQTKKSLSPSPPTVRSALPLCRVH